MCVEGCFAEVYVEVYVCVEMSVVGCGGHAVTVCGQESGPLNVFPHTH